MNETIRDTVNDNMRKRICLIGPLTENKDLLNSAKLFNVPVIHSETGKEFLDDSSWMTFFILSDFHGPVFESIYKSRTKHKYVFSLNS